MHWENIKNCAASGYFDFIAHLDQIKNKVFAAVPNGMMPSIKLLKLSPPVVPVLSQYQRAAFDDGIYPSAWIIKELNKRNVPVVISDDAHRIEQIGENFVVAESLLEELHYQNRLSSENLTFLIQETLSNLLI
jgi:histidinol phosphatase-like PHP family hydrolase